MRRFVVFAFFVLYCAALAGCQPVPRGQEPPHDFVLGEDILVEGIDISRMEIQQAERLLNAYIQEQINGMVYTVRLDGAQAHSVQVQAVDLPIDTNLREVLREAAYLPQHNRLRATPRTFALSLWLDTEQAQQRVTEICASYALEPIDATATFDANAEGYFLFTSEHSGREVAPEELLSRLAEEVKAERGGEIALPYKDIPPAYTELQAREEHQLVSTFTTSYAKSPLNASGRVFNIKKAAGLINGYRLEPGEEFNINDVLGPRTAQTGWKTAPGIREGRYEQEYGGGVCQVSTTLFNAVLMADLTITERRPHSWPSGYVDIGRDATISTGGPNFRFVNSGSHELYVVAKATSDKKLSISIYGKPLPDGVTVKISSRRVATLDALGEDTLLDESLPANTRKVYREARRGKKSQTFKEYYDAEGNLLERKLVYEDTYRSIKGIVYLSADLYYGVDSSEEDQQVLSN